MAGGPSTVPLAAAVSEVGGLGFLATGYRTADAVTEDLAALKIATSRPFGLNVFVPSGAPADPEAVQAYAQRLAAAGLPAGEARFDDDAFEEKVALLARARPAVVSFAFGLPPAAAVAELQEAGIAVWITVTTPAEAAAAAEAGADALVAQGAEAGGHRGGFDGGEPGDLGLLALLQLCETAAEGVPLVATGGIMTGRAIAAVLAAGAAAAALGTAFMRAPEAGTPAAQRTALASDRPTAITRAFTGRPARGIVNAFMRDHDGAAPVAYPEVHHLTSPARAAARERGDAEGFNLWAGQAHGLATAEPAGALVERLAADARAALSEATAAAARGGT